MIELSLSQARNDQADQLDLRLSDADGQLGIPPRGAMVSLALGWQRRGLVDKGTYKVDEIEHSGAPDVLTLRARSTDLSQGARLRETRSWTQTTLGALLTQLAADNALIPRISPMLAGTPITHLDQSAESDLALLNRLAKDVDAVGTIQSGHLLFAPIGHGISISGTPLPSTLIRRQDGDNHRYNCNDRGHCGGVGARWHDLKTAQTQTVWVGEPENGKILAFTCASASAREAENAAKSEYQRIQRQGARLSLTLALGNPALYPEQRVQVRGFKPEIDGTDWLIVSLTHRVNDSGLITELELEVCA